MSVEITTLPSGLRIATDRMAHLETASLGVWVGSGDGQEQTHHSPADTPDRVDHDSG